jgi:predicted TIM-barrel fold metal-dependent hydrolase
VHVPPLTGNRPATVRPDGTRVIDTHVHVWALDDKPGHQPAVGAKIAWPKTAAPVEDLIDDMDAYGIARTVLIQSSAFGWDNTYVIECVESHPGRLAAIGLVDPESPTNAADLRHWMGRGLAGVRFHPLFYDRDPRGAWWVDAPENDALWNAACDTGAILQFHMWPRHADALARMIARHPNVRVIIDHIGKPDVTEAPPHPSFDPILRLADFPDVFAKIGDYQIASKQGYPYTDTHSFVTKLVGTFGADRMMWGTGFPGSGRLVPLQQALDYVERDLPLTAAQRQAILWDTPARLFGLA